MGTRRVLVDGMPDDELIRAFADLSLRDAVPDVPDPGIWVQQQVARLVDLGVMPEPSGNDLFTDVLLRARDACGRYLERTPTSG